MMVVFIKFNDKFDLDVFKIVFIFSCSLLIDIGYFVDVLLKFLLFLFK